MPGSWMLSVQRVRPVMRRWSSLRVRALPISVSGCRCVGRAVLGDRHDDTACKLELIEVAACCTALTMLW